MNEMTETMCYIWLSLSFSYGSTKPMEIASRFDDLRELHKMTKESTLSEKYLSPNDIKLLKSTSVERVIKVLNDCNSLGIKLVTMRDKLFPKMLLQIYGAPIVLYYKGDIQCLNEQLAIGIVGTRRINNYSAKVTDMITTGLSQAGAVIVSGGAVGVDAVAHQAAINANGKTIAVAGCGIDVNYPAQNETLRNDILKSGGAIISELPPKTITQGKYFPVRNRIISGLSKGICLPHAPVRSGSLITAEHAIQQGKDIFCVPPWDITNSDCMGVTKYIKEGCVVVTCAEDILSEYTLYHQHVEREEPRQKEDVEHEKHVKREQPRQKEHVEHEKHVERAEQIQEEHKELKEVSNFKDVDVNNDTEVVDVINVKPDLKEFKESNLSFYNSLDENEKIIFDVLSFEPQLVDEILINSKLSTPKILTTLTDFELKGIITPHSGRRYSFKAN